MTENLCGPVGMPTVETVNRGSGAPCPHRLEGRDESSGRVAPGKTPRSWNQRGRPSQRWAPQQGPTPGSRPPGRPQTPPGPAAGKHTWSWVDGEPGRRWCPPLCPDPRRSLLHMHSPPPRRKQLHTHCFISQHWQGSNFLPPASHYHDSLLSLSLPLCLSVSPFLTLWRSIIHHWNSQTVMIWLLNDFRSGLHYSECGCNIV